MALCLDFLFTHLLIKEPVTHNPLKLIFRVLLYATKNKYPRNRSALMYWDNKWYSRINLCKNKFGGPFSAKEVEDVKSFWIICMLFLGLLIIGGLVSHTDRVSSVFVYHFQDANYREAASYCMIKDCLSKLVISNFGYIVMVVSVPLYEFLIMPILWKYLMEMRILKQLVIGGLLIFMGILSVMALQVAGQGCLDFHTESQRHYLDNFYISGFHLGISPWRGSSWNVWPYGHGGGGGGCGREMCPLPHRV